MIKKKRRMFIVFPLLIVLLVSCLVGCESPTPDSNGSDSNSNGNLESFTMNMAITHPGPPKNLLAVIGEEPWKEYVEKITRGRINVDIHYDGTLVTAPDMYRAVETGICQMAWVQPALSPGAFPLMDVFTLPGLMRNWATNNVVMLEILEKYSEEYEGQFSDDVAFMAAMVHMQSDLHLMEPISNLEDLKGKIIACTSEEASNALKLLGVNTTIMASGEFYVALERGVVDGALAAWGMCQSMNMHDVAPYHVYMRISPIPTMWFYNREAFDKLSETEQLALLEYGKTMMFNMNRANARTSAEYRSKIPEENFIELPAEDREKMQEMFKPAWDNWVEKVEALGYPGRDILNDILYYLDVYTFE